jgi:methanogenic corrinoid protein MtbC1
MSGEAPLKGLNNSRRDMEIVDRRFENCGYFIPDLIYSAEILKEIT